MKTPEERIRSAINMAIYANVFGDRRPTLMCEPSELTDVVFKAVMDEADLIREEAEKMDWK
jgi:hypothetical protein